MDFHHPSRLDGVVMVSAGNSQDSPQHGGGNSQPAANQHHYGHCQAHQCLLFALLRAYTRVASDSLVAAMLQAIDQRSLMTNPFALSKANNCR
jgi:hypothetical protein